MKTFFGCCNGMVELAAEHLVTGDAAKYFIMPASSVKSYPSQNVSNDEVEKLI